MTTLHSTFPLPPGYAFTAHTTQIERANPRIIVAMKGLNRRGRGFVWFVTDHTGQLSERVERDDEVLRLIGEIEERAA